MLADILICLVLIAIVFSVVRCGQHIQTIPNFKHCFVVHDTSSFKFIFSSLFLFYIISL